MALTNSELGQRLGCSQSMASRLRAGKRLPGHAQLPRVLDALNVPLAQGVAAYAKGPAAFGRLVRAALREMERSELSPTG